MSKLKIITILCRAGAMDNYSYLLIDEATGTSAVIDPSEAAPVISTCRREGVTPDYILNTHHHYDHTDANLELKELFHAQVVGAETDAYRIPGIDITVKDGQTFNLGSNSAKITRADGHTQGHILWYFKEAKALFTGDVLFNLCVGGLFEGTPEEMFISLSKIKKLPDDVVFYPGHEYTAHGVGFARYANPDSPELEKYLELAQERLNQGLPVAPVSLGLEKAANPYLQAETAQELERLFNI